MYLVLVDKLIDCLPPFTGPAPILPRPTPMSNCTAYALVPIQNLVHPAAYPSSASAIALPHPITPAGKVINSIYCINKKAVFTEVESKYLSYHPNWMKNVGITCCTDNDRSIIETNVLIQNKKI